MGSKPPTTMHKLYYRLPKMSRTHRIDQCLVPLLERRPSFPATQRQDRLKVFHSLGLIAGAPVPKAKVSMTAIASSHWTFGCSANGPRVKVRSVPSQVIDSNGSGAKDANPLANNAWSSHLPTGMCGMGRGQYIE